MNSTPFSDRFYIGIFGRCNVGKSSLINAITNQNIATTSKIKGTTTDPVFKAMEIFKIGACVFVDTPGFDDETGLGKERVRKSFEVLDYVDAAIFVLDRSCCLDKKEKEFLKKVDKKKIPLIVAINKSDLNFSNDNFSYLEGRTYIEVSSKTKKNIGCLIDLMSKNFSEKEEKNNMIYDLINPFDVVVLVVVMDKSYPKERLILPQQQLIYEILKKGGICYIVKDTEYEKFVESLKEKPKLVVVDSQIFSFIYKKTDRDILITSFSILMARKKGILNMAIEGVVALEKIKDNDMILIIESCTHKKKSCDIGSVKIPSWIKKYTNKNVRFSFKTGDDFLEAKELKKYSLVIHCGGCMTTARKIRNKFLMCKENGVFATNYGVLIAYINGILGPD